MSVMGNQAATQTNLVLNDERVVIVWTLDNKKTWMAISKGPAYDFSFTGLESGTYKLKTVQNGHINITMPQISDGVYTIKVPSQGISILESL